MDQDKFSLLKSHVEAYTRKDGAVVGAHDTKVQKHPRVIQSAIDTLTPNGDQEWTHGKNSSSIALGAHRAADSGDVLGDHGFSYDDDSYETMSHPDGHTATIKDGTLTLKHGVAKPKLSEGDSVKVTGNVQGAGKKGVIHETAPSGHFHIVKHADGSKSSYHESNLAAHDPDEDEDEDEDDDRHGMLKSHIDAFTRKDGTTVQAHDDKRVAAAPKAPPLATHAAALAASSKPGDLDHEDNQIAAGYMKSGDHKSLAGHLKNLDTAARDHILDHVHPDHREGLGFKQLNMDRSQKQYAGKFPAKAAKPKTGDAAPETKSQNEDWGFHGEAVTQHLKDKHGPDNYYRNATEQDHKDAKAAASKKFADTAHKLVQAGHFEKHDQARDYLDATHGRHLHDAAPNGDIAKVPWLAKDVKAFKRKTGSTGA